MRRALPGSWEELFHDAPSSAALLVEHRPHARAPARARDRRRLPPGDGARSHYFHARLADQFDLVIHLDETHALEPLDRTAQWETGEVPDLYPWGV